MCGTMSFTARSLVCPGPGTTVRPSKPRPRTLGIPQLAARRLRCNLAAMATRRASRLWHPFADMAAVSGHEFVIARGEDVWIYDETGRRYLDATASLWYSNVGHGR